MNRDLPSRLFAAAKSGSKPHASRKGVGGRPPTIGEDEAAMIEAELRANNWDMTYAQLEEATAIGHSVLQRWFTREVAAGRWREVGKGYRPHLTEDHRRRRVQFAQANRQNRWHKHVDIDEKWFYATSMRRKLKVPLGEKRPTIPVKSKRFIPKVMVLTAIARPSSKHNFDGKVGCWRVCERREAKRLYGDVSKAWSEYPSENLTKIFDTKQLMMEEIIKANGDNDFKLPHKRKRAEIDN